MRARCGAPRPRPTRPPACPSTSRAATCCAPTTRELVGRCVEEHALDPARLCLEISEIALLDDLEVTSEALRALKDLGVRLAIDDFGTGGSSLTYLRQFPFDELKIDSSFIAGVGRSAADDAIVAATIDMAHALGMIVAAEGVETELQRRRSSSSGATARRATCSRRPRGAHPAYDSCSSSSDPPNIRAVDAASRRSHTVNRRSTSEEERWACSTR